MGMCRLFAHCLLALQELVQGEEDLVQMPVDVISSSGHLALTLACDPPVTPRYYGHPIRQPAG